MCDGVILLDRNFPIIPVITRILIRERFLLPFFIRRLIERDIKI